jgi:hypothetical protein
MEDSSFPIFQEKIKNNKFNEINDIIDKNKKTEYLWLDNSYFDLLQIMKPNDNTNNPLCQKLLEGNLFRDEEFDFTYLKNEEINDIYLSLLKENYLEEGLFLSRYMKNVSFGDTTINEMISQYISSNRTNSLLEKAKKVTEEYYERYKIDKLINRSKEEDAYSKIDYCYSYMKTLYEFYEKNHQMKNVWFLITLG